MNASEILKKVRSIEIKTKKITNNLFSGSYNSAFKGRGMIFSEVRKYVPGDDIRDIDWNVTAKLSEPHVKIFEEERDLNMMLIVDVSGSEFFGSKKNLKNEKLIELCAVLSFSAIKNNDKVGVILFTDKIELFIPPKKGKKHVLKIIRELINFKPTGKKTDINQALSFLNNILNKKAIIFLLSDFFDKNYQKSLNIISKKHDVVGLRIYDSFEKRVKNIGFSLFYDLEKETKYWIDTASKKVLLEIERNYNEYVSYFQNTFLKSGANFIDIEVNESYTNKLLTFFKNR